jgi:CMP/dCMP kinase
VIVTISNEYGSGALAIAQRVALALGYAYVDQQLPVVVAKRLNLPVEVVEANEDTGRTLGERLLSGLEISTPELAQSASETEPFDEEVLRAIQQAVVEYADRGNVVIVGRGGGLILKDRTDVIRVFMHAPRDWRIARIVATGNVDEKTAAAEVDRVDRARTAYNRDWYAATFGDPVNYDLSLDTSRLGEDRVVACIVAAVRAAGA